MAESNIYCYFYNVKREIEGLILSKTKFQDRHLICKILLRSGKTVSVIFYGGQGGGTKKKSSILELGHMIQIQLKYKKSSNDDNVFNSSEWKLIWSHEKIREDHKAFYLMCFYLEVINKLSIEEDIYSEHIDFDTETKGLFRVLSNSLVHLNASVKSSTFDKDCELLIFIGKLLVELGVFPMRSNCVLTDKILHDERSLVLLNDKGGFATAMGLNIDEYSHAESNSGRELWEKLGEISTKKYDEIDFKNINNPSTVKLAWQYLCFQFQLETSQFKTSSMVM